MVRAKWELRAKVVVVVGARGLELLKLAEHLAPLVVAAALTRAIGVGDAAATLAAAQTPLYA